MPACLSGRAISKHSPHTTISRPHHPPGNCLQIKPAIRATATWPGHYDCKPLRLPPPLPLILTHLLQLHQIDLLLAPPPPRQGPKGHRTSSSTSLALPPLSPLTSPSQRAWPGVPVPRPPWPRHSWTTTMRMITTTLVLLSR